MSIIFIIVTRLETDVKDVAFQGSLVPETMWGTVEAVSGGRTW